MCRAQTHTRAREHRKELEATKLFTSGQNTIIHARSLPPQRTTTAAHDTHTYLSICTNANYNHNHKHDVAPEN